MAGTQLDCYGIVSANSINSFTVVDGSDTGNSVGDYVEMLPTAAWGQDLSDALTSTHNRSGGLKSGLTITTPTISSPTLTTPTITDFTNANHTHATVVQGGQIPTAGIADAAITQAKLDTTAGGIGAALQSWTPTWTNLTIGNGTNNAKYVQIGKMVFFRLLVTWGSTTSASGSISFSLPVTSVAVIGSLTTTPLGPAHFTRNTTIYAGVCQHLTTTTAVLRWHNVTGAAIKLSNMSGTSPDTWTTSDEFHVEGWYEAS